MDIVAIQILTFTFGCGLAIGASLSLLLWIMTHPPSELPKEMLFASEWVVFKRYFLVPMAAIVIGLICIILPFFTPF